jgi:hypothetical protein
MQKQKRREERKEEEINVLDLKGKERNKKRK